LQAFSATLRSQHLGDVMADHDQSKVPYDDFVGKVQSDPANPQSTIMLAGYAGAGPEGHVRIYPDPTLGNWYDVPFADVVHSMPIPDSKLGGSYVWIRSSAEIKPGSSTAAAPQGAAPAAAPQQQQQIHPQTATTICVACNQTPATVCQPTPATHCFICPPITKDCTVATVCTQPPQCPQQLSLHCPSSPVVCDTPPHSVGIACTVVGCPPQSLHCPSAPIVCDTIARTAATACTQVGCHTPPVVCIHPTTLTQPLGICPPTQPVVCGILPPTIGGCTQAGCVQGGQQQGLPQAQAMAGPAPAAAPQFSQHICPTPSAVQHCGQPQPFSQHICPTPSAVHQCGQPTLATVCTQPFVCGHTAFHTQCICPTPTVTANIVCVLTANTPCLPFTLGGCTPQSIACTVTTPVQNGVFNPLGLK
jgi:hypothetical protein